MIVTVRVLFDLVMAESERQPIDATEDEATNCKDNQKYVEMPSFYINDFKRPGSEVR